jgi:hypothetical protein
MPPVEAAVHALAAPMNGVERVVETVRARVLRRHGNPFYQKSANSLAAAAAIRLQTPPDTADVATPSGSVTVIQSSPAAAADVASRTAVAAIPSALRPLSVMIVPGGAYGTLSPPDAPFR